jgi:hypothetical protein
MGCFVFCIFHGRDIFLPDEYHFGHVGNENDTAINKWQEESRRPRTIERTPLMDVHDTGRIDRETVMALDIE